MASFSFLSTTLDTQGRIKTVINVVEGRHVDQYHGPKQPRLQVWSSFPTKDVSEKHFTQTGIERSIICRVWAYLPTYRVDTNNCS